MKLSLFMPSLEGGGAEQVMMTLANGFAAEGHDVDFVLSAARGKFLEQLDAGVRVVDLGKRNALRSLLALAGYLREEKPHAMLSALSHTNIVALLAARIARAATRMVISERTSFHSVTLYHRGIKDRAVRGLMRFVYPRASALVAVSSDLIAELEDATGLPAERICALPNPIVSDRLLAKSRETPDHPWFSDQKVPVILSVGRLAPEKDFETLLRAFAILRRSRRARLVILGEGPQRPGLESLAAELEVDEDFDLPGFRANPFPSMRAAALFVLSSRFEGSPGALVQAMACGTPVVSTDCRTGPREILEAGRWGELVAVGDAEGLAAAMARTLDGSERPDVALRAAHFDERESVRQYLRLMIGPTAESQPPGLTA